MHQMFSRRVLLPISIKCVRHFAAALGPPVKAVIVEKYN